MHPQVSALTPRLNSQLTGPVYYNKIRKLRAGSNSSLAEAEGIGTAPAALAWKTCHWYQHLLLNIWDYTSLKCALELLGKLGFFALRHQDIFWKVFFPEWQFLGKVTKISTLVSKSLISNRRLSRNFTSFISATEQHQMHWNSMDSEDHLCSVKPLSAMGKALPFNRKCETWWLSTPGYSKEAQCCQLEASGLLN